MPTYISLLRGINVSGQKKILMADLKQLYEILGFSEVQTFIQSGNVVFNSELTDKQELEEIIHNAIHDKFGFKVPIFILTEPEIEQALTENPYSNIELMYLTFLSEQPSKAQIDHLYTYHFDGEYYQLKGKVLYFHCPKGAGKAKMNTNFIEQKLKVTATSRNLKTTKKLLEMAKFTRSSN